MTNVLTCSDISPLFLLFSPNVPPLIYYSYGIALISSLFLGIFIFAKNRKSLPNQLLFFMLVSFASWVFASWVFWATNRSDVIMFSWSITLLVEPMVYAAALCLLYVLTSKKDLTSLYRVSIFILFLPLFFLLHTPFALKNFDIGTCLATEGPLALYYTYAIEIIFTLWAVILGIERYRKAITASARKEILYILVGTILLLLAFASGNIIGSITEDWNTAQIGLFGMPIFIGFLAYSIVKFSTFNVKLIATQALVFALIIIIAVQFLFIKVPLNYVLNAVALVAVLIFGTLLVGSVRREIVQRERLEVLTKALGEANEKLKSLDKLKTEFLSLASHQLRSPLTAIKGYTSMLLDGSFGSVNTEQKEAIDRVFQSSEHLAKVVEDLLDVSKIEQGGMKYEMVPFDFGKVCADIATNLNIVATKKGLSIVFSTDNHEPYMVNGDSEKIRQVILNLVDNAIKYTKAGIIQVRVGNPVPTIVRFSVQDNGMGVTPEIKSQLFQKFSRGEGGKVNTGGSGLGLYLAKQIVEAHKGKIWVESEGQGKGSTFIVELKSEKT